MDNEAKVARGRRAEQLLNDELLKGAFADIRAEYIKGWEDSAARDADGRERLWLALQIVGKVQTHLKMIASDGKIALHEMQALKR